MKQYSPRIIGWMGLFKRIGALISLWLVILIGNGISQIIVDNPEKPKNKKAGRIVMLEEVMRIRDDGKNSVFRNPRYLSVLRDGSLIFFDYPYLYKYDKNGKFIFKALKQGNGPGECDHPNFYFIDGDRIYVYSWVPPKVLEYDINGRYLKEEKTPYHGPFVFLGFIDNKIFGIRDEIRFTEFIHKEGFFETPFTLYEISPDFNNLKKIYDIPMKHYIKKAHWWRRVMFVVVPFEHFLFIVHTSEYGITKFDLRSGRIERIFKRKYARLKSEVRESEQDVYNQVPKQYLPPPLDYVFDVLWIQVFKKSLWVFTSTTKDDGAKTLVDVFDMEGNYTDCFYLKFPLDNENHWLYNILMSDDGFILVTEQNKDTGLVSIGKYRIKDSFNP